jgi:hypothetical protein
MPWESDDGVGGGVMAIFPLPFPVLFVLPFLPSFRSSFLPSSTIILANGAAVCDARGVCGMRVGGRERERGGGALTE